MSPTINKKIICIAALVLLLSMMEAHALALNGNQISPIIYEPGKRVVNSYSLDVDTEVSASLSGQLLEYITLSEIKGNGFDLIIQFPDKLLPPDTYTFELYVSQASNATGQISAMVSLKKIFRIEVYSNEKEIQASLSAPHVNENGTVPFHIGVLSRGYQNISSVWGEIFVRDVQNRTLAKLTTSAKPLPALAAVNLQASFNTTGLPASDYRAEAVVHYDEKQKNVSTWFKVGKMDLILKNYTSELDEGFAEMSIRVVNNWGNELRNVYAKLFIEGTEILQTPTISLNPWEEGELKGIVKTELLPGVYDGKIALFFEGEMKEIPITLTIKEVVTAADLSSALEQSKKNQVILLGAVVVLLFAIFALFVLKRSRVPVHHDA